MDTQNENLSAYEYQSFDPHPTASLYPVGWDLSALLSAPTVESTFEVGDSADNESYQP